MPVPDSLALTSIADGATVTAAPLRNNFASIQTTVNALKAFLNTGNTGSLLNFDGTDWSYTQNVTVDDDRATISIQQTVDNAYVITPTLPTFALAQATITKTNSGSAFAGLHAGFYSAITYGDSTHSPVGTVQGITSVMTVTKSGNASNEHAPYMGWLRYDATTTPGRAWFADFSLHGALATQQDILTGINMFANNYYNGSPISGSSSAIHVISRPGTGGGADAAHLAATTYPMDVGIGISGKSGVPATALTRGFTTGLKIGGTGGGWGAGFGSLFGTGIEVSDWENIGINISARAAGTSASQPSLAIANTSATAFATQYSVTGEGNARYVQLTSGEQNWGPGSAGFDVQLSRTATDTLSLATGDGLISPGGLVTKTKAGVPSDADIATGMQTSGCMVLDTTNNRIYFRCGSTWRFAALT